ncbi:MAG: hypothetical protein FD164_407 [Nitrospirae bacterium]|nr:MAG: hypothetical protein FD164_407 [Nitrospirota bacterium]
MIVMHHAALKKYTPKHGMIVLYELQPKRW